VPSDLTVVGTCSISASKHAFATLKNNYAATNNLQITTPRKTKACKQKVSMTASPHQKAKTRPIIMIRRLNMINDNFACVEILKHSNC
jgi:hypothetical protein